jgi:hypothetical protein
LLSVRYIFSIAFFGLQSLAMFDAYLVPKGTVVTAKGDGVPLDVNAAGGRMLLLLLNITDVVEQQSLDVSVLGSADGNDWGARPLIAFPQKFYRGEYPMLLDLSNAGIRFLRAHWEVNRWGRGPETPRFEFSIRTMEVTPEVLQQSA